MHQPSKMNQTTVREVLFRSYAMKPARMNAQTARLATTHTA